MQHIHIQLKKEDEAEVVAALKKLASYGVPTQVAADILSQQFHLGIRYGAEAVSGTQVITITAPKGSN